MNHRYGSRLAVHLDVDIHQYGKRLGRYQTRDISPYGVFLETGTLDLQLGTSIDLLFILSEKPEEIRKIKGMVIRRSLDGAGFMLSDHYRKVFLRLKQQDLETQLTAKRDNNEGVEIDEKTRHNEKPLVSGQLLHARHDEAKLMEKAMNCRRDSGRKFTIHTKQYLDCSAHSSFMQACESAEKKDIQTIVVDLNATQDIRASGLGMLLMLRNEAKALNVQMSLENCNPEIKTQLDSNRLLAGLPVI